MGLFWVLTCCNHAWKCFKPYRVQNPWDAWPYFSNGFWPLYFWWLGWLLSPSMTWGIESTCYEHKQNVQRINAQSHPYYFDLFCVVLGVCFESFLLAFFTTLAKSSPTPWETISKNEDRDNSGNNERKTTQEWQTEKTIFKNLGSRRAPPSHPARLGTGHSGCWQGMKLCDRYQNPVVWIGKFPVRLPLWDTHPAGIQPLSEYSEYSKTSHGMTQRKLNLSPALQLSGEPIHSTWGSWGFSADFMWILYAALQFMFKMFCNYSRRSSRRVTLSDWSAFKEFDFQRSKFPLKKNCTSHFMFKEHVLQLWTDLVSFIGLKARNGCFTSNMQTSRLAMELDSTSKRLALIVQAKAAIPPADLFDSICTSWKHEWLVIETHSKLCARRNWGCQLLTWIPETAQACDRFFQQDFTSEWRACPRLPSAGPALPGERQAKALGWGLTALTALTIAAKHAVCTSSRSKYLNSLSLEISTLAFQACKKNVKGLKLQHFNCNRFFIGIWLGYDQQSFFSPHNVFSQSSGTWVPESSGSQSVAFAMRNGANSCDSVKLGRLPFGLCENRAKNFPSTQ